MSNSFDLDGRGPSQYQLLAAGSCFIVIATILAMVMVAKSKGELDDDLRVQAELVNVGDGLPAKSDVKFRGVLVGYVTDVTTAGAGRPNLVRIALDRDLASGIPETVTARVVPSNVFAVSSVQLVARSASAGPIRAGQTIHEDQSLPTVLFQTTLNKVRDLLLALGRQPSADSVGALTAVGQATAGRGRTLLEAGTDLNDIVDQLNAVIGDRPDASTLDALTRAADGLRSAAPDLFDALDAAVRPMTTLAKSQADIRHLLAAGLSTAGTLGDAFDHQMDRLITITTELTPVIGVLADNGERLHSAVAKLQNVAQRVNEVWNPQTNLLNIFAIVSLTPDRTYVRADCPRYGELVGPSCHNAPEIPTAPALIPALAARGVPPPPGVSENRDNLSAPRDSIKGIPVIPDTPPSGDPMPPTSAPPIAPPQPPDTHGQSATIGGNVGPVGSTLERDQISRITGSDSSATDLLLGPLLRGTSVQMLSTPRAPR